MKHSRICAGAVATLAMFAADRASADVGAGGGAGGGNTVVLNTYAKVWVSGDDKGPNEIGKNTGAGTMDAHFTWDKTAFAADRTKVPMATCYTRSDNVENNGNNGYMQGGFALATLAQNGIQMGPEIALPKLNGERTFMRPQCAFVGNYLVVVAAAEDNGKNNNNPMPVLYLANKQTGALVPIPNSTRGNNLEKPTNLIQQAQNDGVTVRNANDQRGPHSIACEGSSCVVGMQYNNTAQEAFKFTVANDGKITVNWLKRYSEKGTHCRPQVALTAGATRGFLASVEADQQPAEVGVRVTEFDWNTGEQVQSNIVVNSIPDENKYVSSPNIHVLNDSQLTLTYGMSHSVKQGGNNNRAGHAGGKAIDVAAIVNMADLKVVGAPQLGVGQYGRHGNSFVTAYGPNAEPALAVISGSSTGTGAGFIQVYPIKANGELGVKDAKKVYTVADFSDVANVQARGKRNPQDQARGFINGLGSVPNPGYTTDPARAQTSFMPEVKSFSVSTVTGYSGPTAAALGIKNSVWLALVPASWQEGLSTIPGTATDKPGTNPDGTGPLPRSTAEGTDPSGEAGGDSVIGGEDTTPRARGRGFDTAGDGCACKTGPSNGSSALAPVGLAVAGLLVAARRRRAARELSSRKEA